MTRRSVLLTLSAATVACAKESQGFTSLMPKSSISELWTQEGGDADTWSMRDGMIYCAGVPDSFLRSKKIYRDFVFRAEWRFIKEGWVQEAPDHWPNAGFFINAQEVNDRWPRSLEVQGHYGEAGSLFGVRGGDVKGARRGPIDEHRIPFGDWDKIEVQSKGGVATIILNGQKINEGHDLSPEEGNICLQAEGWPLYYRALEVREL
ncbi:MAG: DUF1080 domain-containing protein [Bryobacterales bacterium]